MEVHHRSRRSKTSRGRKKKWGEHLWEFMMLFLAVFCGFFAENLREHYIEHQREKKYIRPIVRDLTIDTTWMNTYLHDQQASIDALDSVIDLLKRGTTDSFSRKSVYYLTRMAIKLSSPNKLNYAAYDQMRSSGTCGS